MDHSNLPQDTSYKRAMLSKYRTNVANVLRNIQSGGQQWVPSEATELIILE